MNQEVVEMLKKNMEEILKIFKKYENVLMKYPELMFVYTKLKK